MTAVALHALLVARGFKLHVQNGELLVDPEPPPEIDKNLQVLHSGVRALLTGKKWYGSTDATSKKPWVGELSPAKLIPEGVGLLCVACDPDGQWDRIAPYYRIDNPQLFECPSPRLNPRRQDEHHEHHRQQGGDLLRGVVSCRRSAS